MFKSYKLLFILSIILATNTVFASENPSPISNNPAQQSSNESGAIKLLKKWFFWDYFVTPYFEKKEKKSDLKIATRDKDVKLPPKLENNNMEKSKLAENSSPAPEIKNTAPLQPVAPVAVVAPVNQPQAVQPQVASAPTAQLKEPEKPTDTPVAPKLPDDGQMKSQPISAATPQENSAEEPKPTTTEPEKKPETLAEQPKKPTEAEILAQADKDILVSEQEKPKKAPSLADLQKEADKTPEQIEKEEIEALELASFMKDEIVMLQFPRDEVVLGNIRFDAMLAIADDSNYIKYFWRSYDKKTSAKKSRMIREFIHEVAQPPVLLDIEEAKQDALIAVSSNDISTLRAVLNHTKINLLNLNDYDFNLIQASVGVDNYDATYYLIMRGANVNVTNADANQTLIQIAQQNNSPSMVWLLKKAGAKDYGW